MTSPPASPPAIHPLRDAVLAGLVMLAVASAGVGFTWFRAYRAQFAAVQSELSSLARSLAVQVDGDVHRTINAPEHAGSPAHLRAIAPLVAFHKANPDIFYVYTAILQGDRIHFVLGSDYLYKAPGDDLPGADPIMQEYTGQDPDLRRALTAQVVAINARPIVESERTYMSAYAPFFDSGGRFVGVVGIDMWVRDLQDRLASIRQTAGFAFGGVALLSLLLGAAIHRSRRAEARALEQEHAAVRAAEAARRRAEEHAAEAAAADQAKGTFLAVMSHEIRTPLNGVLGMAQLMADTPLNDEQREYLSTISRSGEALLGIIDDILDYSKIEAGRIELQRQPFELRPCVEEALELYAVAAAQKDIDLGYLADPGVPAWITGDAGRLRQVLVNLVGNAVKFTDAGEILVRLQPAEDRPGHLHVVVRDTGIGIPADRLDRLFKSFSQVDSSNTRQHGGTGLGLAIARRIVELMDGRIWVESRPGAGSSFHFTFAAPALPRSTEVSLTAPVPALVGLHVLVVDDNPSHREIVSTLASTWGMHVSTAANGTEALALLNGRQPCDLAILDQHMPGMDGDTLAFNLHLIPHRSTVPLILLTSAGSKPKTRFDACLAKPVRAARLREALVAALHSNPPHPQSTPVPVIDATFAEHLPLSILVADDLEVNRTVCVQMLARLGFVPEVVSDGSSVLTKLAESHYDVVLLDLQMPGLDGLAATRQIRENRLGRRRPWIVAVTAAVAEDDRQKAYAAGVDDFIAKPIRLDQLAESLVRAGQGLAGRSPSAGPTV